MRSIDEQMKEIRSRAGAARRGAALSAASVCLWLILAAAVSLLRTAPAAGMAGAQYGSLVLASPFPGYVIVGVLAFALGICVALLCREVRSRKRKDDRRGR